MANCQENLNPPIIGLRWLGNKALNCWKAKKVNWEPDQF